MRSENLLSASVTDDDRAGARDSAAVLRAGRPEARPLSTARFRELSKRAAAMGLPEGAEPSADVREKDLRRLGCSAAEAAQVTALLAREDRLEQYLETARLHGLFPLLRGHGGYPVPLQRKLGMSARRCFSAQGTPCCCADALRGWQAPGGRRRRGWHLRPVWANWRPGKG